jgi:Xaa-Pro aminopeptidase
MSVKRIAEIKKQARRDNFDGVIVTHMNYIRYLTGFTGSAGLLVITGNEARFLTDFRYKDQAARQVKGAKVSIVLGDPTACLKDFPRLNSKNRTYAYDLETTTVGARQRLGSVLSQCILVPDAAMFAGLGWVKDRDELSSIKKAVEISDLAFERIVNIIAPGVRERDIAAELEYQMMMLGSEKPAFDSIVASGVNSAMPHAGVSARKVKKGEFVTMDFGATVDGYVSDITRTVMVGKASQRQKKIYGIVLKAQKAAIRKVKAGVMGRAVDGVARNIITKAGYGKEFGHGTGHGIGFFVHVGPRVSSASNDKLMVNNVITIEPGIYISGWGGVRIEDDVVVTKKGCDVLNRAPKNLLEL